MIKLTGGQFAWLPALNEPLGITITTIILLSLLATMNYLDSVYLAVNRRSLIVRIKLNCSWNNSLTKASYHYGGGMNMVLLYLLNTWSH